VNRSQLLYNAAAPRAVFRAGGGLRYVKGMTGSFEFSTWVALAGAAIVAGLCAIYGSSLWVLIPAALIGAFLGYKSEQIGRRYLEQYLLRRRSR
jgi:hypothetical protein